MMFRIASLLCFLSLSANAAIAAAPATPQKFRTEAGPWRVDLSWTAPGTGDIFQIQRAVDRSGPFVDLPQAFPQLTLASDFIGSSGEEYFYRVRGCAVDAMGGTNASQWTPISKARPRPLNPQQLLTDVQRASFRYFYDYGHPASGLARVSLRKNPDLCEIGGTGWALFNLLVGVERGFISRQQGAERVLKILRFLDEKGDRFHGVFPHWMNGATGKVIPFSQFDDGADLVETAFLMEGAMAVREYFSRNAAAEAEIRQTADRLSDEVDWKWFAGEKDGRPCLLWHWSPRYEWKKGHGISGFNECQIVYLLALASRVHPVDAKFYWQGWEGSRYSTQRVVFGVPLELGKDYGPPLFWTHYSYLGFDPHRLSFHGKSYFEQFERICEAQILYARSRKSELAGYDRFWGLTASTGPKGYRAFAPGPRDNGTIAPTAALSSMPYVPEESRAFLTRLYEAKGKDLWGPFGFYDAFNLTQNWISRDYLGNDAGPIAPMIENYRSGLCWRVFMRSPEIKRALRILSVSPNSEAAAN